MISRDLRQIEHFGSPLRVLKMTRPAFSRPNLVRWMQLEWLALALGNRKDNTNWWRGLHGRTGIFHTTRSLAKEAGRRYMVLCMMGLRSFSFVNVPKAISANHESLLKTIRKVSEA